MIGLCYFQPPTAAVSVTARLCGSCSLPRAAVQHHLRAVNGRGQHFSLSWSQASGSMVHSTLACSSSMARQHAERGAALAEAGDMAAALLAFQTGISLDPSHSSSYEMMAQVLLELEECEEAQKAASAAVQLAPEWAEAHVTLARAHMNMGAVREALQAYHRAQSLLAMDDVHAHADLEPEVEEALALYSKQLEIEIGVPLVLRQVPGDSLGPGCVVWDCGMLLASYLCHVTRAPAAPGCLPQGADAEASLRPPAMPSSVPGMQLRGAHVLELGSGTGIVGLAAAALGAHVTLTELPSLMPALKANVTSNAMVANEACGSVRCAPLDWTQACAADGWLDGWRAALADPARFSIVLGADLVYAPAQVAPVVGVLQRLLSSPQPPRHILLAHKHRSDTTDASLMSALQQARISVLEVAPCGELWTQQSRYKPCSIYYLSSAEAPTPTLDRTAAVSIREGECAATQAGISGPSGAAAVPPQQPAPDPVHVLSSSQMRATSDQQATAAECDGCAAHSHQQQKEGLHGAENTNGHRRIALLGFGLPGVGKTTILRALAAALPCSVYLDKDDINAALLQAPDGTLHAYFSDYYNSHVRVQSYQVQFKLAASHLKAAGCKGCVAILDGQFGDKLLSPYIMQGLELPARPLLGCFECSGAQQRARMQARGEPRDDDKYAKFDELRASHLTAQTASLKAWDEVLSTGSGRFLPVVHVNTEAPVGKIVQHLMQLLQSGVYGELA